MDTQKRSETIQKLAAYLLHYCPMGALKAGETSDVALCYPRKASGQLSEYEVKALADGRLLDLPIADIKAVASSKTLARLVGADRASFLVRRRGESKGVKGAIRLSRKVEA